MSLTVATWNVEYADGAERNARRAQLIQDADADVFVLTETHDELRLSDYMAESTSQREGGARPGARWTTIWSRLEVRRRLDTADSERTVAVELEGDVIVYGTVLPWHTDTGPSGEKQANWAEFRRVVPIQGAEWRALRQRHPGHTLIVAGDFNQSLGDRHFYGGRELRELLEGQCASADLAVLSGLAHLQVPLAQPAIDHIAVAPPAGSSARAQTVTGWEGAWDGPGRLSDHSAVAVTVELGPPTPLTPTRARADQLRNVRSCRDVSGCTRCRVGRDRLPAARLPAAAEAAQRPPGCDCTLAGAVTAGGRSSGLVPIALKSRARHLGVASRGVAAGP